MPVLAGGDRYADAFGQFVRVFLAQHQPGSRPEVVAASIEHALTTRRPRFRYLVGRHAHPMAVLGATLPAPVRDGLLRRVFHQPAPGSRVAPPEPDRTAVSN